MRTFLKMTFAVLAMSFVVNTSQAQTSSMSGFRKNFAIVAFAGLGGAVLGLSTLSFYGAPSDHVGNITTGFLVGLGAGLGYVAVDSSKAGGKNSNYETYSLIDNPRSTRRIAKTITLPVVLAEF